MENLEKVELIREKCNVSYEKAREALEACDYDVLDAIIAIEREEAEAVETTVAFKATKEAEAAAEPLAEYEVDSKEEEDARQAADESPRAARRHRLAQAWERFCTQFKGIVHAGLDMTFIAERKGEQAFAIPVLFVVIGMLVWGAALWLMVIGLFLGFRYHIDGASPLTVDLNAAMDKAADVAEDLRHDLA